MRRFPFYVYPNSFYTSPAEASYHRPHRPFSPASSPARPPASTPHSVINVPVVDAAPSWPSSSPPRCANPPDVPLMDPSSAATTIQSHFRGFCVRRHHPLLNLRFIATARKQLEELQSEIERPEFPLKVRSSETERLRFSDSVMAIILRLDAIEGSIAEVRRQRKEATKMAIKLQDVIDAIMMQKDEIAAPNPAADEAGMAPGDDSVLSEQPQEPFCHEVNMVQEEVYAVSANGIMDGNILQEKPISPEGKVAGNVVDMVTESVSPLHPCKTEDLGQQRGAGSGCSESAVPQVQPVKALYTAEQDMSHHATGENSGSDATHATEEEVGNGIDALRLETNKNHMQGHLPAAKADQDACVNDMIDIGKGSAENTKSTDGSYTRRDVVQEGKEGISQDVALCPGTPKAEEKCDYPHDSNAVRGNELQDPSTSLERLTEGNCPLEDSSVPTLHTHGYEEQSGEAHAKRSCEAKSCDEVKTQASTLSMMAGTLSAQDSAILHQLSEDCRQLKSLVGKLLVQNKAQSNVLCVLGERLEMLEHQQQPNWQQKMREKRKLKKGSKRSVKCRNGE